MKFVIAVFIAAPALLAFAFPAAAAEVIYRVDPTHTTPSFEVKHRGNFTTTRGLFSKSKGMIRLDRVEKSGSVEIEIETASVTTGYAPRDQVVREWLKTEQFPTMSYRSKNMKFSGDDLVGMEGELTLAGITRPVSLNLTFFTCFTNPLNKRTTCGADGVAQIKRSAFGMTEGMTLAADDIKILIQIEATPQ